MADWTCLTRAIERLTWLSCTYPRVAVRLRSSLCRTLAPPAPPSAGVRNSLLISESDIPHVSVLAVVGFNGWETCVPWALRLPLVMMQNSKAKQDYHRRRQDAQEDDCR